MQSVQSIEAKRNLKIKKSKLTFGVVNESSIIPSKIIDSKEKKVSEITFRSLRQSNLKFKTINYKNYDIERKSQYEKRKTNQRPISLYLDGANPTAPNHSSEKVKQTYKKEEIINFKDKSLGIGLIENIKSEEDKKFLASKKSLKAIILKEIEMKNKRRISQNKKIKIDVPEFSDVEELFTLKKIEKHNHESQGKNKSKSFNQKLSLRNDSERVKKEEEMILSQKLSVFSERKVIPKKNKMTTKNPENLSQVILPMVDKKLGRPLITLDFNEARKIESESFIVLKYPEKQVISGKAYKKNAEIASLTKIMTFYTILTICQEFNINYTERVVEIVEKAEEMSGTSADIFSGEKYTLKQLFYAMMLPSGNDAAVAIAYEGGLILKENKCSCINLEEKNFQCFITYMNVLTKKIGMITSAFTNPHGLSDHNNHSNPYELSLLIAECMKFEEFLKVVGTKSYSCWIDGVSEKREVIWENTHKLLRREGFIGGKTGVTVTAGPCLGTIYKSSSEEIFITVVLRAPKLSRRFKETRWILGLTLKEYKMKYDKDVKLIMKSNPELDSDNSEDEQRFDFNKNDSSELRKRNKILQYEL